MTVVMYRSQEHGRRGQRIDTRHPGRQSQKDCQFTKKKDDTALRVVFQGNIYLGGCGGCCKRWFITFNGAECSGPLAIDVAIWIRNKDEDNHRPGAIEGYCDNIHK